MHHKIPHLLQHAYSPNICNWVPNTLKVIQIHILCGFPLHTRLVVMSIILLTVKLLYSTYIPYWQDVTASIRIIWAGADERVI